MLIPAAIEGDSLPDERELFPSPLGRVRNVDESRLASAPAADGVDELHAPPSNLRKVEHTNLQPVILGHLLGRGRKSLRIKDVARLVA